MTNAPGTDTRPTCAGSVAPADFYRRLMSAEGSRAFELDCGRLHESFRPLGGAAAALPRGCPSEIRTRSVTRPDLVT